MITLRQGPDQRRRPDGRGDGHAAHPRRLHGRGRRAARSSCSTATPTRRIRWPARRRWPRSRPIARRACSSAPRSWRRIGRSGCIRCGPPHVIDIRNIGLMGAVELAPRPGKPGERAFDALLLGCEKGVMLRTTGDTIAMSPPLIVTRADRRDGGAARRGAGRARVAATIASAQRRRRSCINSIWTCWISIRRSNCVRSRWSSFSCRSRTSSSALRLIM